MARETSVRVNRQIRAREVRLIGADGTQIGVVTLGEALEKAEDHNLDLVEVAPTARPPVCRIMDYGKFKYEQSKKAQEARKKQTVIQVKEIKMRPRTDVHDLDVKKKRIRKFIEAGNKVKVTIRFRGRERVHSHLGKELLKTVADELSDISLVEHVSELQGPTMHMVLAPKKD